MIDDKSPAEASAESSVENAENAAAKQLERERAQAENLGEETAADNQELRQSAQKINEPAQKEEVVQIISEFEAETAEANSEYRGEAGTEHQEDPTCFQWRQEIASVLQGGIETEDAEQERKTAEELKKEFQDRNEEEKNAQTDSFRKEYIANLGFEEDHDRMDDAAKLAGYAAEQQRILERLDQESSSPELEAKRAKYLEIKREVRDIYHMNDQTKIEAVNDYRRTLGGLYRDAANMMKYQYLSLGLEDREQLRVSHMDMVLTIDKLEKTASSLMKGLDDMDPEDKSLWERFVEGWEKFDKKCGELAKKSEKYTKRIDPFFFSLGAMLFYILDEKRMDEFMESVTKKKVWKPVRAKALK